MHYQRFQMLRKSDVKIKESGVLGVVKILLRAFFEPERFMAQKCWTTPLNVNVSLETHCLEVFCVVKRNV